MLYSYHRSVPRRQPYRLFFYGCNMAKDYSKQFYNSSAWKKLSEYVRVSRHYICEECGEYGSQVHHIIEITPDNINDTSITLNEKNLQLLCEECHNKKRKKEPEVSDGLMFGPDGDLFPINDTPRSKI